MLIFKRVFADGFCRLWLSDSMPKTMTDCCGRSVPDPEQPDQKRKRPAKRADGSESGSTAAYRARRMIDSVVHQNSFNYFVTLTFADQLTGPDGAAELCRRARRRLSHLCEDGRINGYLVVPELTKAGVLHLHGFLLGPPSAVVDSGTVKIPTRKKPIKVKTYERLHAGEPRITVYNVPLWEYGHSVAYKVGEMFADRQRAARYICKYITKDGAKPVEGVGHRYYIGGAVDRRQPDPEIITAAGITVDTFCSCGRIKCYPVPWSVSGAEMMTYIDFCSESSADAVINSLYDLRVNIFGNDNPRPDMRRERAPRLHLVPDLVTASAADPVRGVPAAAADRHAALITQNC